jgi:predicted nucleic acid-binding Zn ribbon protein
MRSAGLGLKMAQLMRQKPTKKCARCGLKYPEDQENCPHCFELTEAELDELKDKIEEYHKSNANIGKLFFYFAAALLVFLVLLTL